MNVTFSKTFAWHFKTAVGLFIHCLLMLRGLALDVHRHNWLSCILISLKNIDMLLNDV